MPAASVVVTLASITLSPSATRSLPGTLMLKVLSAKTRPVKALPLTVRVTVSPSFTSPPTRPVTAMSCLDSAALITSSGVMLPSRVMLASGGVVSSRVVSSVALAGLPAASVTLATTVRLPSASPLRSARVW